MPVLSGSLKTFFVILVCAVVMGQPAGLMAFAIQGGGPAGTVISNQAAATYRDDAGTSYSAVSPTVTVTIQTVAALSVTPDETTSSASVGQGERLTRAFRICNTGNIADSYTVTNAEVNSPASLVNLHFDVDGTGTLTAADILLTLNGQASTQVSAGECLGVVAVVDTNDSPMGSNLTIRMTARSNVDGVNGRPSDDGTIINAVGAGARLTSPTDANLPPLKTVNGASQAIVSPGATFTYTLAFRNSGDGPARSVVVTDNLKAELEYAPGSLSIDGRNLTDAADADEGSVQGRSVVVQIAEVAAGQVVRVSFRARLVGNLAAGVGVLNSAEFTALNIVPTNSSLAVVIIDPFGTVFSGRGGAGTPIPGANVVILRDQDESILSIPPGTGFEPNIQNENPFLTDGLGHFSFALPPEQLGTEATPARYFIRVTAQGYSTRMLERTLHSTQAGLFSLIVHALDGQALARAGGFDLVTEDVGLEDLASIAFNIPMFETHGLEISKSADRPRAEIGDAVAYRVEIRNPTAAPVSNVVVRDRLPASFHYATGTGRVTIGTALDQPIEPEINGTELTFRIGEIGPAATARLLYRVRVGANAQEGEQENVAVGTGTFPSGEIDQTAPARASVIVGRGAFSTRQVIVGRVFVDQNRNNKFDDGDKPVPGARLYLQSGQSVVTDSEGLYNVPSLGDGSQVLSLDPISLPDRYSLADGGTLAGRSWTRLMRTPLGGGGLLRQNFALVPNDLTTPAVLSQAPAQDPVHIQKGGVASDSVAPRISWQGQPGVSRYRLQLAADERFENVIFDGEVPTNEYISPGLAP
ncbi:MAG: isopeptide-forming domain-containing fimbrial protein, partial [Pyrinomonadaceae bacterium]